MLIYAYWCLLVLFEPVRRPDSKQNITSDAFTNRFIPKTTYRYNKKYFLCSL